MSGWICRKALKVLDTLDPKTRTGPTNCAKLIAAGEVTLA